MVGHTVCSPHATSCDAAFGFTESEVAFLLDAFGLKDRVDDVRRRYGGYRVGNAVISRPEDVLTFCSVALKSDDSKKREPKACSKDILEEFLEFLPEADADRMQALMDDGEIELALNEQLTYTDFVNLKSHNFWRLLLLAGYLTVAAYSGQGRYRLFIPNEEIRVNVSI